MNYTNWTPGEPNNLGEGDCVHFSFVTGNWSDLACNNSRVNVMCERLMPQGILLINFGESLD